MGILNFDHDTAIKGYIIKRLKSRGLIIDESEEWEVHGPHYQMDYQVYIGPALYDKKIWTVERLDGLYVAIYPRGIYELEDTTKWHQASPENKIYKPKYNSKGHRVK